MEELGKVEEENQTLTKRIGEMERIHSDEKENAFNDDFGWFLYNKVYNNLGACIWYKKK